MTTRAFRAAIFHCLGDPGSQADPGAVEHFDDGLLIVRDGLVDAIGSAATLLPQLSTDIEIVDLRGQLIIPGFVDCHVHYPQIDIIASYGERLLDWLNKYAFPAEERLADVDYATELADFFTDALLANGTTTALVFATVHPHSVDAIFSAAQARGMRLIAGKVLMDCNCPETLRDTAESGKQQSRELIERWHGVDRLAYAITPRFAVTSSEAQLTAAGELAQAFDDVYVHTHLAENAEEVELIGRQFPWSRSYLDVYDHFGLVRQRSVFAHCLHLDDADRKTMSQQRAAIAFCPSSNLFLGSGLFDLAATVDARVRVGIGSDVGGGTGLCTFDTLSDAYKTLQLRGQSLPALSAFYLATLGGARALDLDDRIGNFAAGKEADFVVLDANGADVTRRRLATTATIDETLFALMMLGDERAVSETYIMGQRAHAAGSV